MLYLDWYRLRYYCRSRSSKANCFLSDRYWQIQRSSCTWVIHTEEYHSVVSGLIQTEYYWSTIEFESELYLSETDKGIIVDHGVIQRNCIWINTDLWLIVVRHLLHAYTTFILICIGFCILLTYILICISIYTLLTYILICIGIYKRLAYIWICTGIYTLLTFVLICIGIYTLNLDTPSCKRYARDNVNINLPECARSAVGAQ